MATNNNIPELQAIPAETLRFYRLIEDVSTKDGVYLIALACGHMLIRVAHRGEQYMLCFQCQEQWITAERERKERAR